MIYTLSNRALKVCYRPDGSEVLRGFIEARNKSPYKTWHSVENYAQVRDQQVIYICAIGSRNDLARLELDIKKDTSLKTVLYREVNYEDLWVFEAFSSGASKAKTVAQSAKLVGAERIVAFGDNYNDLPLFEGSDVRVAVANAVPEVIAAADFVCKANTEDGVVQWIAEDLGISL